MASSWPKLGPRELTMAPRWPQENPRWPQDAPILRYDQTCPVITAKDGPPLEVASDLPRSDLVRRFTSEFPKVVLPRETSSKISRVPRPMRRFFRGLFPLFGHVRPSPILITKMASRRLFWPSLRAFFGPLEGMFGPSCAIKMSISSRRDAHFWILLLRAILCFRVLSVLFSTCLQVQK